MRTRGTAYMLPKVDGLGLQILFILLPGIIALGIVKSIGPKRPRSDFEHGLQIFLYGIVSYVVAAPFYAIYIWTWRHPAGKSFHYLLAESLLGLESPSPTNVIDNIQIVFATIASVCVGISVSLTQTYSVMHTILRQLNVAKRINENDIWGFTFNSPELDSWVTVRHPNGKIYQGWVRGYSDGADDRELILGEVQVYVPSAENPGDLLSVDEIPVLYLGLDRKNVVIEMRTKNEGAT
jgi:hypothetical protein